MDILLTLPPRHAGFINRHISDYHDITAVFSDPAGKKLGSGGGTVNVIRQFELSHPGDHDSARFPAHHNTGSALAHRKIILHSDGESRRLPAYAVLGKSFIPMPVSHGERGQKTGQTLYERQLPLLEMILGRAPEGQNTLVASGDALLTAGFVPAQIPRADVVCLGIETTAETASKHGVFVVPRHDPAHLCYMLQKPPVPDLLSLPSGLKYLLDTGIWLLSDRAVSFLFSETGWNEASQNFRNGSPDYYDLYKDFGRKLGSASNGTTSLTACILLPGNAEFFHFGSNSDLLSSTNRLRNLGNQAEVREPGPGISGQGKVVRNAKASLEFDGSHLSIWIENCQIPDTWTLHDHHILTGIPENEWQIDLPAGICLDVVPVGRRKWCIRPYGMQDSFRGKGSGKGNTWMNHDLTEWFALRGFSREETAGFMDEDLYEIPLFPVVELSEVTGDFVQWLLKPVTPGKESLQESFRLFWHTCQRLSSLDIIQKANHARMSAVRKMNIRRDLSAPLLGLPPELFYQLDLDHLAAQFRKNRIPLPASTATHDTMTGVHDLMFRSVLQGSRSTEQGKRFEHMAFGKLRQGMLEDLRNHPVNPVLNCHRDQILSAGSPLRLDLAGGWTDTPPYCILNGGTVVNMAVELNGQPPVHVYLRPKLSPEIGIHSVDLGVHEVIRTFRDISRGPEVGSASSISRAALMLAGFCPGFSSVSYPTLKDQLRESGGGFDITVMVAAPKGSGLGTSSILAATLLGGLSDFYSLGWDRHEVAYRTLLLEQILTTGGGWQDQFGGIFEGVKLIESNPGMVQQPGIRMSDTLLFTQPETRDLILLYYTGITRVAKNILAEIVKGMFLNSSRHLAILSEMKCHAQNTFDALQRNDWEGLSSAVRFSWELNQKLDAGTNPAEVSAILHAIRDYAASYKLLGAGGGGYLMIFAKDAGAAKTIKTILNGYPGHPGARFVEWDLSQKGMMIAKS
ncbi:MAG: bifunctional fucokinase/fucose-1-phosphate guanylyltransferase [Bacteroidota bacterium]